MDDILIVGAGQAGMQIAVSLRELGFAGAITLIGSEPVGPYQRPPLSKAYLSGEADLESLELRAPSFYDDRDITLRCGDPVASIEFVGDHGVALTESGARLEFAQLARGLALSQLIDQANAPQGQSTLRAEPDEPDEQP